MSSATEWAGSMSEEEEVLAAIQAAAAAAASASSQRSASSSRTLEDDVFVAAKRPARAAFSSDRDQSAEELYEESYSFRRLRSGRHQEQVGLYPSLDLLNDEVPAPVKFGTSIASVNASPRTTARSGTKETNGDRRAGQQQTAIGNLHEESKMSPVGEPSGPGRAVAFQSPQPTVSKEPCGYATICVDAVEVQPETPSIAAACASPDDRYASSPYGVAVAQPDNNISSPVAALASPQSTPKDVYGVAVAQQECSSGAATVAVASLDNPNDAVAPASLDNPNDAAIAVASLDNQNDAAFAVASLDNQNDAAVAVARLDNQNDGGTPAVVVDMMFDDDPAMRKIMEEERLMSQARMRSVVESTPRKSPAAAASISTTHDIIGVTVGVAVAPRLVHQVSDEFDAKPAAADFIAQAVPSLENDVIAQIEPLSEPYAQPVSSGGGVARAGGVYAEAYSPYNSGTLVGDSSSTSVFAEAVSPQHQGEAQAEIGGAYVEAISDYDDVVPSANVGAFAEAIGERETIVSAYDGGTYPDTVSGQEVITASQFGGPYAEAVSSHEAVASARIDGAYAEAIGDQEGSSATMGEAYAEALDTGDAVAVAELTPGGEMDSEDQAFVVGITDERDLHPSERSNADVQAEFVGAAELIGEDFTSSQQSVLVDASARMATVAELDDGSATQEVTVLDSKPRAISSPAVEKEVTVLEASPRHQQGMWTEQHGTVMEEIAVTGVDEAEAVVTAISEDVHPSDMGRHDFAAQATLIGRDFTRAVSVPNAPPRSSDPTPRGRSEPTATATAVATLTNPFEDDPRDTLAMSRDALSQLDAQEAAAWASHPIIGGVDDDAVPSALSPPNAAAAIVTDGGGAPMAEAAVLGVSLNDDSAPNSFSSLPPSCSDGPPAIPARSVARPRETSRTTSAGSSTNESLSEGSVRQRSSTSTSSERRAAGGRQIINSAVRGTNQIMTSLFGDTTPGRRHHRSSFDETDASAASIRSRELLPWSVFPSETTGMYVATVNTNQKALDNNNIQEASKALRAFSVPTKQQAEALARAWAPPRMLPFVENTKCYNCEGKFAVFRRPCHCRNCGVCICSGCAVQWPSKMIPDTYNIKKESLVNICKSCDWLCSAFRSALLDGNRDQAIAIHATGNVNLVTPFANVKGELFYPVHCAVIGGSLTLLKWLVDDHCCPLRSIRISGKTRDSSGSFTPILTSRGRSLLGIAMQKEDVDLIRYLVVDKGMPLSGEKEMSMVTLIRIMDRLLRMIPSQEVDASSSAEEQHDEAIPNAAVEAATSPSAPTTAAESAPRDSSIPIAVSAPETPGGGEDATSSTVWSPSMYGAGADADSVGSIEDPCIICYANSIDSVATPCGHQICCMTCGGNISKCPVCQVDCSFIRFYKP